MGSAVMTEMSFIVVEYRERVSVWGLTRFLKHLLFAFLKPLLAISKS